jgi:mannitol/fructose-specific phosphotransferase system IIA component (Ntr-type)
LTVKLTDRIAETAVVADLEVDDRDGLFRWITEHLRDAGRLGDCDDACRRLLDREKILSTAIHPGVAVPHARCQGAKGVTLSVVKLAHGMDFGAADGTPVRLVFALIGPPEATAEHVRVLGQVAKLIQVPGALDGMLEAKRTEELLEVIAQNEPK